MTYSKFKVCRRISENVWQAKKLTPKQNNLIRKLKKNINRKQSDFSIKLQNLRKFSIFYGNLPINRMKDNLTYTYLDKQKSLLMNLETRLDVILVRIHFCSTLYTARQLITHGKICVNFNKVDIPGFSVRNGDVISVMRSDLNFVKFLIKQHQDKSRNWAGFGERAYHFEVNYKTLNAILLFEPSEIHFPYKIELNLLF
uniref:Ribosomal protein S4 n=1 Tax=Gonatozygon brebissonii TaxID=184482 RepID=A0A6G9IG60_9VIRI|nr:ribosomal protein S4 [Gonatozygon brebissonii]QIQ23046.1 ribosomal protein S4 [Gonatozygon brebissonii]